MIDDMALLKQAMEEMDAEDPAVAQAAKDRAAQALGDAGLNFSKMAGLIEQRRLLLRPRVLAGIKRMDQPGMLGDSAFRDTSSALRKDGQSFYQIAEALDGDEWPASGYEDPMRGRELPPQMGNEPVTPAWLRALTFVASIIFFPLLHPIRFLAIALLATVLFYSLRGLAPVGRQVSGVFDGIAAIRQGADNALSSVNSFIDDYILRRSKDTTSQTASNAPSPAASDAAAPPRPPASIPSAPAATPTPPSATPPSATAPAPPATAAAPPAAAPAPSTDPSAAATPPSASPARPPVSTPSREARGKALSRWAADCEAADEDCCPEPRRGAQFERDPQRESDPLRVLKKIVPEGTARNSRVAGPCIGGVGGCAWGGAQY